MTTVYKSTPEMREAKREIRQLKKYLKLLTLEVTHYLAQLDVIMAKHGSVPERGAAIGKLAGALNFANDQARYFGLGVNFRTDKHTDLLAKQGEDT